MNKVFRTLAVFGAGVAVGLYWPQIRSQVVPRLVGANEDAAVEYGISGEAL